MLERKIAQNTGLLYKARPYIDINILFCHCIILTYIPISTMETLQGELQPGQTLQTYTVDRNMLSKLYHLCHLFKKCKVHNIYPVNIRKNLVSVHQINSNTVSITF